MARAPHSVIGSTRMRPFMTAVSAVAAVLAACQACPIGSEACPCTAGGGCDTGLACYSNRCVDPTSGSGGGSAGSGGGTGGAGGGSLLLPDGGMRPPPPPSCSDSSGCAADEVCTFDGSGGRACVKGSQRACDGGLCVRGMAFERHVQGMESTMRGHTCTTSDDCPVINGHVTGICVDVDGASRVCVPLCQYHDDAQRMGCATDPRFGVITGCSRDHARLRAATELAWICASYRMSATRCLAPTAALSSDLDWTVGCMEGHLQNQSYSCGAITVIGMNGCFTADNPGFKMDVTRFLNEGRQFISYATAAGGGGSSGGSANAQCSTDCDCGRCSYCDKSGSGAVCRYAGEGAYGCYRGCD